MNLRHIRLDVGRAKLPSNGYAVIPVPHKIGLVNLVYVNRRQPPRIHCYLDSCPPIFIAILPGQEAARKVVVASHAAHNSIQRDVLQCPRSAFLSLELLAHVLVGKECDRPTRQARHNFLQVSPAARPAKVLCC